MADRYQNWTRGAVGGFLAERLGLPRPELLRRFEPGRPALAGPVALGGAGRLRGDLADVLKTARIDALEPSAAHTPPYGSDTPVFAALLFDATGLTDTAGLAEIYEFCHARIRALAPCARVLVLGTLPEKAGPGRVAQRSLEGFVRSMAKELRRGATANVVLVGPDTRAPELASTIRFLLSDRSAYVSGQVLRLDTVLAPAVAGATDTEAGQWDWDSPLYGRTAVVTGAARGIGAVIAETLARDGASVTCVDLPGSAGALHEVAARIGGRVLEIDITDSSAGAALAERFSGGQRPGIDVFVHNAGVLRDKTLARMDRAQWDTVLSVNLRAVETLTRRLLDEADPLLRHGGRIVCTSSIAGIAGNVGQTNYAASKAGLIGLVEGLAPELAGRFGATANAVAPGFIETRMTASVPLFVREAGRRMNSMRQGGLPVDVAEAVAYLASPGSGGVNGQTLRVCGQSLLGA